MCGSSSGCDLTYRAVIQMFRPYVWVIFRLWFNLQKSYTKRVVCSFEGVGDWVWGEREIVVSIQLHVSAVYVWPSSGCDLTYRAAIQVV